MSDTCAKVEFMEVKISPQGPPGSQIHNTKLPWTQALVVQIQCCLVLDFNQKEPSILVLFDFIVFMEPPVWS
jgi:hypothetical protein